MICEYVLIIVFFSIGNYLLFCGFNCIKLIEYNDILYVIVYILNFLIIWGNNIYLLFFSL